MTTCTRVGISVGSAVAIPVARVAITCAAACRICGSSSMRLFTSCIMMDKAAAASSGKASVIPVSRVVIMLMPTSRRTGRLASSASPSIGRMVDSFSIKTSTKPETPSAKVSAAPAVPFKTPCSPSPIRETKGSMAVSTSAAIVFKVVIMGSAIAPSWA